MAAQLLFASLIPIPTFLTAATQPVSYWSLPPTYEFTREPLKLFYDLALSSHFIAQIILLQKCKSRIINAKKLQPTLSFPPPPLQ
jgi:hypothetical protein